MVRILIAPGCAAVLMACSAASAIACPSCYGSVEKNVLDTYYMSAVALSLLPFGIVGTIAILGWLLARELSAPVGPTDVGPTDIGPTDDGSPRRPPGLRSPAGARANRATRPAVTYRAQSSPLAAPLHPSKSA